MIDLNLVEIQKAKDFDAEALTNIAFMAKKHWNYPSEYFNIWKDELTVTSEYVKKNFVYKTLYNKSIVGFYAITENRNAFYSGEVFVQKGYWLEHIFIIPGYHKNNLGKLMIKHALAESKKLKIKELLVFVDPFAKGFYDRVGAKFLYYSKSSIPNREIPVYKFDV